MRAQTLHSRDYLIRVEEFKGMREMLKVTHERPENYWSECKGREDGSGFKYESGLLLNGWESKTKEIMRKLEKVNNIRTKQAKINERYRDVMGYVPVVPDALKGLPKSMINTHKVLTSKGNIVEIVYDAGASSRETSERVLNHGVEILRYIYSLELAGYRVRLSVLGFKGQPENKEAYFMIIPIKEENQPLDISRIAYPIASIEMLRTFVFYWYEHLPNAMWHNGYGRSLYLWADYQRKQLLDKLITRPNQYYINLDTDLKEMFAPLLKKKGE